MELEGIVEEQDNNNNNNNNNTNGGEYQRTRRSSSITFGIEEDGIENEDMSGETPASRSRVRRISAVRV